MSLPRYPEYKDSGVNWLGEVPAHWDICAFRHVLRAIISGLTANQVDPNDETVAVTRIETISSGKIDFDRLGYINRADAREDKLLKAGDILFSNINSLNFIGNCAQFFGESTLYAGMNLLSLRPKEFVHARWLFWLVRSNLFRAEVESRAKPAINQASISQGSVLAILICHPPVCEQAEIADFIDRETAKIDALIAEQEKLIALLAEKRQATISRAVTRGLDPNVPLKESGVPWLGKVPEYWIVKRFRDVCLSISTGPFGTALGTSDYISGGVPVINPSHIVDSKIVPDDDVTVSVLTADRLAYWVIRTGEIVVARRGELGRAAVVEACSDGWICGTGSLRVTPNHDCVTAYFLHAILQSKYAREWLNQQSVGSTMANLNEGILGNLPIVIPVNLEEQSQLIDELSVKLQKIDRMISLAEQNIALSQERRAALISAAVTGKIDVRGLAA